MPQTEMSSRAPEADVRAAALTRVAVTKQRAILIVWFTLCCGILVQNWPLIFTWCALAVLAQFGNGRLAKRIVEAAPDSDLEPLGRDFLVGSAVSGFILACIAPITWFLGGEAGRMAALFLSAGALVNIAVSAHRVKVLAAILAAPYVLVVIAPLLMSVTGGAQTFVQALCVAGIGVAFLSQIVWALKTNSKIARALEIRTVEAETRRGEAEAASQVKSDFIANMSHELRTPLNAIIGYSEMLHEELRDLKQSELADDAHNALGAAKHLLAIVNQILNLSKIDAGRAEPSLEAVDLDGLVAEIVELTQSEANKNGVSLSASVAPGMETAFVSSLELRQCLLNLISNAIKFAPNGSVDLAVASEEYQGKNMIVFSVRDDGIGIAPDVMSRIFEPFVQADTSITRGFGGTGLGLTITRKLAHAMGGDVSVESVLGQGSVFTLRILARLAREESLRAAA